jgi:NDP-sugar pyrophosphorylase family protein
MLLAAGRGTRLGELSLRVPKILVEVGGRPLLARQLDYLTAQGADPIVMNASHLADQVLEFAAAFGCAHLHTIVERELLGTAGGLRNALPRFRAGEPVVVMYGDTLLDAPLDEILVRHVASAAVGTVCVTALPDTTGKGLVEVNDRDEVLSFKEKPAFPRPGLASAGLCILDPELIELIPQGAFFDIAADLFPLALALGLRLRVHHLERGWIDIGTPASLAHARAAVIAR